MENIESVVFYTIDKSIKAYRQYAQKQLKEAGFQVTIDQWLVLKNIQELPQISQQELSRRVFKDNASVTRIIDLLVKQGISICGISGKKAPMILRKSANSAGDLNRKSHKHSQFISKTMSNLVNYLVMRIIGLYLH